MARNESSTPGAIKVSRKKDEKDSPPKDNRRKVFAFKYSTNLTNKLHEHLRGCCVRYIKCSAYRERRAQLMGGLAYR